MHSNNRKTKQKKCCSSQKVIEGLMKNNELTSIDISLWSDFADLVLYLPGKTGWPCCKTGSSTDISPSTWSLASHRCAGKENCSPEKVQQLHLNRTKNSNLTCWSQTRWDRTWNVWEAVEICVGRALWMTTKPWVWSISAPWIQLPKSDFHSSYLKVKGTVIQVQLRNRFLSAQEHSHNLQLLLRLVHPWGLALGGMAYQRRNFLQGMFVPLLIIFLSEQELKEQVFILQHCLWHK